MLRVWLKEPGAEAARPVPSPADLQGRSGVVRVQAVGDVSEHVRMFWALSLGLFVARGGDVRWL